MKKKMTLLCWLLLAVLTSSIVNAHYCSCFPGSADFSGYMCTYSEPKTPLFDEKSQSFKFTMVAEQLRANVGCAVKDGRHDCIEGSGCELDCVYDNCGVPIAISSFAGKIVQCEKNEGQGWNECGDEFEFKFGEADVPTIEVKTDKRIIGSVINEECGSSPYRINIPVEFVVTDNAVEADYKITVRTSWDPDVYNPCEFSEPEIDSNCKGEHCGKFIRESFSDFIVTVSLKENTASIEDCPRGCSEGFVCDNEAHVCVAKEIHQPGVQKGKGYLRFIIIGAVVVAVIVAFVLVLRRKQPPSPVPKGPIGMQGASQQASYGNQGPQSQVMGNPGTDSGTFQGLR